eukprot:3052161-Amphidinium_carterae.2
MEEQQQPQQEAAGAAGSGHAGSGSQGLHALLADDGRQGTPLYIMMLATNEAKRQVILIDSCAAASVCPPWFGDGNISTHTWK